MVFVCEYGEVYRGALVEGAKGVLTIIGVLGLAPPCTIIGVLFGFEFESGIVISLATFDCILTDLGVANLSRYVPRWGL